MITLKEAEVTANKFADVIKLALEGKENKANPGTTTPKVKSRQPPLWLGQQYERCR